MTNMRNKNRGGVSAAESNPLRILGRLLGYMMKYYKVPFCLVAVCILAAAGCSLRGILFMRQLVDDFILPLISAGTPDFGPLKQVLLSMAATYTLGVICAYAYNRMMVNVSQGTMMKLRTELFTHMESLPIRYFDANAHGDIMSVYTNDVDTLRQLISQSIPQVLNSAVTVMLTFFGMVALNLPLTVVTVVMTGVMILVSSRLSRLSGNICGAAEISGKGERLYRRNDGRAEGGESVLP